MPARASSTDSALRTTRSARCGPPVLGTALSTRAPRGVRLRSLRSDRRHLPDLVTFVVYDFASSLCASPTLDPVGQETSSSATTLYPLANCGHYATSETNSSIHSTASIQIAALNASLLYVLETKSASLTYVVSSGDQYNCVQHSHFVTTHNPLARCTSSTNRYLFRQ